MSWPEINHYLETIRNPYGRFRALSGIEFSIDQREDIDFLAGSNSVIFKGSFQGKPVALKCYTKPDDAREKRYRTISEYSDKKKMRDSLAAFTYLAEEIFVFDHSGQGAYYPVLLTEWVEGVTLGHWLTAICRKKDRKELSDLARRFAERMVRLLEEEWAHGDLKPDNIIVTPDGTLRLIDYDNLFVPALAGNLSPELGTPAFQHPARTPKLYNRHLDDYSIALIATALHALAEFPEWGTELSGGEFPLFDPDKTVRGKCERLIRLKDHWVCSGKTALYQLAALLEHPSPEIPTLSDVLKRIIDTPLSAPGTGIPGITVYRENGLYGFRVANGNKLTEAIYEDVSDFSEGVAGVRIGKKRYYIEEDGKRQIDASGFDRIESFSGQLAAVRKGGKWGYLHPEGKLAIPLQFEEARPFREGLAAVRHNGKYGYIDRTGSFRIDPLFDTAFDFRESIAVVARDGHFGYIDPFGTWVIAPIYSFASGFRDGRATAEKAGKRFLLTRNQGRITETIQE